MPVTTTADEAHAYIAITRLQGAYGDIGVRSAGEQSASPCAREATFRDDFGAAGAVGVSSGAVTR